MTRAPITIRASSFGSIFDCPSRWIAIHLERLPSPSTGKAQLGTAIHAGTAVFDTDRVNGVAPSLEAACDAAAEAILNPDREVDWADDKPADAIDVAVSITSRYATIESPKHEFVAVEARVEALHVTDLDIILTGTTDRVYRAPDTDELGIADIKSGKTIVHADGSVETKGHAAQLGVYELVAQAAIGAPLTAPAKVIGLQTNKTPDKQRIATADIVGAREPLLGDEQHTGLLTLASRIVHGEVEAGVNPKSMMCSARYCPRYATCFWRR